MSDERAVSKVVLNGKTLIDITNSTVTNENLLDGEIATGANGRGVVGEIPTNTSANLTTNGATVTVPAGYYAEQVSKTIASGSATTPSTEITANPSITVSNSGLITTSAAANESITPTVVAGYVTEGTAGTVTVSGSNTKQLDTSSVVGGTTTISGTNATRAKATWNRGWIQAGELAAATFANSATSGKTYVDISNTTAAPILVSGNYLYINAGYTDNLKISLAKLVPDGASVDLAEDKMLSGYSAYNNNGQLITGNIPTKASSDLTVNGATVNVPAGYYATNVSKTISSGSATISGSITTTPTISVSNSGLITASINGSIGLTPTVDAGYITEGTTGTVSYSGSKTQQLTTKAATTFNTSASDQSIAAGTYLTGKQTIKAVTTANINAENIKDGIIVKVGDANSAGRIKNVTGTFTDSSTVSSGQTAAAAGQMLNGYSAWVDGEEVKGNIATKTASNLTVSGKTVTVPAGYYATQATKDVTTGSATTPATTITANPTITVNTTTGEITAITSASKSITPTVNAGYISTGTAGIVTVNGNGTSQIDVYDGIVLVAGATVYTSARSGVTYTNGISNISPSKLNEIAKAVSNNANITNSTQTIYVDYYDGYDETNYKVEIGNTVSITVSDKNYDFRIIGFNHDDLMTATAYGKATATGKAGITFQMVDCLDTMESMNTSITNTTGWDACYMRSTYLPSIKSTISVAWTEIMKKVNKKTSAGGLSSTINTVSDDLFLLSEIEIFGSTTYSFAGEGNIYAYWSANNTNSARIKNVNGSPDYYWWERSPVSDGDNVYCIVNATGNAAVYPASNRSGVAFGFCV